MRDGEGRRASSFDRGALIVNVDVFRKSINLCLRIHHGLLQQNAEEVHFAFEYNALVHDRGPFDLVPTGREIAAFTTIDINDIV
ncbi:hypothetical protein CK222_27325 [Mesorhizobium sp. WSM3866]|nr:hypothetical protein CK222_27325 [Mesorhizobium sp. WSM3866]